MRTALIIAALLLAPALAAAQDAPVATAPAEPLDAIGALIEQSGGAEIDEDTAERLASPEPARAPAVIAPNAGYVPSYARPNPGGLDRPVMLHETGVSPDGPPTLSELTYESRVRGSIAAAQGLQGPLDGAWTLKASDTGELYAFQMVDPGAGDGDLEGAWRDLKRGEGIGAVGVIDDVIRSGDGSLRMRFSPRGVGQPLILVLTPGPAGTWSGQLIDGAVAQAVTLVRDGPPPTAGYAVLGQTAAYSSARPYDPGVRAAPARKVTAKAPAKKKKVTKKPVAKKKKR